MAWRVVALAAATLGAAAAVEGAASGIGAAEDPVNKAVRQSLGLGYDVVVGNPRPMTGSDDGIRYPLFKIGPGTGSQPPDGVTVAPLHASSVVFQEQLVFSELDLQSSLSRCWSVDAGGFAKKWAGAASASHDFQQMSKHFSQDVTFMAGGEVVVDLYQARFDKALPLVDDFVAAVTELPSDGSNKQPYLELVKKYGTHYMSEVKLGGRSSAWTVLQSHELSDFLANGTDTSVMAQVGFAAIFSLDVDYHYSDHQAELHAVKTARVGRYVSTLGGTVPKLVLSNGALEVDPSWMQSVQGAPVAVHYHLESIETLLTAANFPHMAPGDIEKRAAVLYSVLLNDYCGSVPGCAPVLHQQHPVPINSSPGPVNGNAHEFFVADGVFTVVTTYGYRPAETVIYRVTAYSFSEKTNQWSSRVVEGPLPGFPETLGLGPRASTVLDGETQFCFFSEGFPFLNMIVAVPDDNSGFGPSQTLSGFERCTEVGVWAPTGNDTVVLGTARTNSTYTVPGLGALLGWDVATCSTDGVNLFVSCDGYRVHHVDLQARTISLINGEFASQPVVCSGDTVAMVSLDKDFMEGDVVWSASAGQVRLPRHSSDVVAMTPVSDGVWRLLRVDHDTRYFMQDVRVLEPTRSPAPAPPVLADDCSRGGSIDCSSTVVV